MATYIVLGWSTQQGMQYIREVEKSIEMAKTYWGQTSGVIVKQIYMVMSHCNFVAILEAPNDQAVFKMFVMITSIGNTKIQVLRAFTDKEASMLIASIT